MSILKLYTRMSYTSCYTVSIMNPTESRLVREVITEPYKPLRVYLYRGESSDRIKVSGPEVSKDYVKVVIPFTAKMRRHIITFRSEGRFLRAIAFGMYLHDVNKKENKFKIRFTKEELAKPGFVDQVIELINKVASALC